MDYVKTYCWAHGTYDIHDDRHLSYYQWVPVVLALQVILSSQLDGYYLLELAHAVREIQQ